MGKPTAIVVGVGAEQGLGAAICRKLAAEGHHVFVAGRTPTKLEAVTAAIRSAGGTADPVTTDATREADVVANERRYHATLSAGGLDPLLQSSLALS